MKWLENSALDRQHHPRQRAVRLGDHLVQRRHELPGEQLLGLVQLITRVRIGSDPGPAHTPAGKNRRAFRLDLMV